MVDFHAAAVRFGKPGKLYIAPLGTTEPTTVSSAWPAGWVALGFTEEGSTFNYNQPREKVYVAEKRSPIGSAKGDAEISVEFALAEFTYRNLALAMNEGFIVGDAQNWTLEAPTEDQGDTRVMLGWDAYQTVANNDLRMVWRECLNVGTLAGQNRKGSAKPLIQANYEVYETTSGALPFKIWGGGILNPVV